MVKMEGQIFIHKGQRPASSSKSKHHQYRGHITRHAAVSCQGMSLGQPLPVVMGGDAEPALAAIPHLACVGVSVGWLGLKGTDGGVSSLGLAGTDGGVSSPPAGTPSRCRCRGRSAPRAWEQLRSRAAHAGRSALTSLLTAHPGARPGLSRARPAHPGARPTHPGLPQRPIPAYPGARHGLSWAPPGLSRGPSLPILPAAQRSPWPCPTSTGASNVQVQTETHLWHKGGDSKDRVLETDSVRLLQMYNELQKRYVKEAKTNKEQSEAIKYLTIKINELEHSLQEQRQKIKQLECKKVSWKTSAASGKRSQTPEEGITSHRDISAEKEACCSRYLELLLKKIKKLKKENRKLSAEKRALKNELAGLDKDFFEEVEDLKHAVQESVKLNNEYEKCLKQISVIYGLPFTAHL
ncbi:uncharacterized protein [Taeniopygia guttata]|uniref:uncharacterized protein n=1 Tax=Taeniopygia guttata TaxID=59729 RepID=UPI003BB9698A